MITYFSTQRITHSCLLYHFSKPYTYIPTINNNNNINVNRRFVREEQLSLYDTTE